MSETEGPEHAGNIFYMEADKALRAIAYHKKAKKKLADWLNGETAKIQERIDYWEGQLGACGTRLSEQSGRASVPLPNGSVKFTSTSGKMVVDDMGAATTWARLTFGGDKSSEALRTILKPQPDKLQPGKLRDAMGAHFKLNDDGKFVDGKDEIVPFAHVDGAGKSMSYKVTGLAELSEKEQHREQHEEERPSAGDEDMAGQNAA